MFVQKVASGLNPERGQYLSKGDGALRCTIRACPPVAVGSKTEAALHPQQDWLALRHLRACLSAPLRGPRGLSPPLCSLRDLFVAVPS